MIQDVDESLRALVRRDAVPGNDVEVVLDAPTKEWAVRRNTPTLDLYLYDVREDLRRREYGMVDVQDEQGRTTARRRPHRYFRLSYLVTAWTQRPEDEHRLLSAVLACFLAHDYLPLDILAGSLSGATVTLPVTIAIPPSDERALSEVWTALGGELKPSLDLVVTAPFTAGAMEHAAALVREGLRANFGISTYENKPEAPAGRGRGRTGAKGSRGAKEEAAQASPRPGGETVVGGTEDLKGRIFHLRDLNVVSEADDGPEGAGG